MKEHEWDTGKEGFFHDSFQLMDNVECRHSQRGLWIVHENSKDKTTNKVLKWKQHGSETQVNVSRPRRLVGTAPSTKHHLHVTTSRPRGQYKSNADTNQAERPTWLALETRLNGKESEWAAAWRMARWPIVCTCISRSMSSPQGATQTADFCPPSRRQDCQVVVAGKFLGDLFFL